MGGISAVNSAGLPLNRKFVKLSCGARDITGGNVYSIIPRAMAYAVAVGVMVCAMTVSAEETYYRWTDQYGNVQHSDRPPPVGTNYEVVSTQSYNIRKVEGEDGAVPLETEPSVGNEFETHPKQASATKKNPELCSRAQENLATLERGGRIRIRNDQGELRFLGEEEIEEQKKRARDTMDMYCE